MSMLQAFERLLNPKRAEREDREAQALADVERAEASGDPPSRCKACGYEGEEQYCPRCLADTMRKVRRRR